MSTLPSVAIVILNWNGSAFLEKFLPSVVATSYANKRIIVADNGSTYNSISFLQQHFPAVEIINNKKNYGFAQGYNEALKKVNADYYVLLNSDVEVTPGWIDPIISLMESDTKIAACQPKILSFENKTQFEYAGASGGWIDNFGYPFMRGRVFDDCETDKGQYDSAVPCFWASGAALFVKSGVFNSIGGMDEYFFAHQEEIDLCWRMQLAGFRVYVQPASVVYHVGGGTLPKGNNRKTYLNFINNLIMLFKNLPFSQAIWKIPIRMLLDAIAAWRALLGGDSGFFIAVVKAHFHFMKWLFFEKKAKIIKPASPTNFSGWYNGSIIWDYFIKKKKTFFEIIGSK